VEQDESHALIVAATNHPELLDRALFRRFDDVIEYALPDVSLIEAILRNRLDRFAMSDISWTEVAAAAQGLSPAEISRVADDAAKSVILDNTDTITPDSILNAIAERRTAAEAMDASNRP
jgi:AAA+ superfamily predicted ATPase